MSKYLIENLFGIEGWSIAWYGVMIAVGMVLGVILAIYRARKQGLCPEEKIALETTIGLMFFRIHRGWICYRVIWIFTALSRHLSKRWRYRSNKWKI